MEYRDSYDEDERTLDLHIARMLEVMEWEMTLPPIDRAKRRVVKFIRHLPVAVDSSAKLNNPWLMLGCLERIVHNAAIAFGSDWMERASQERSAFFDSDED